MGVAVCVAAPVAAHGEVLQRGRQRVVTRHAQAGAAWAHTLLRHTLQFRPGFPDGARVGVRVKGVSQQEALQGGRVHRRLGHVEPRHAAQQEEVGRGDFLSAQNHAEHHRLADDIQKLVPVPLADGVAIVGVPRWPGRHGHIDGETDSLDDAAYRVLASQHALLQRGTGAKASPTTKGQAHTLIGAVVHADQAGSFT